MDINKLKGHVPDAVIAQLPDTMEIGRAHV